MAHIRERSHIHNPQPPAIEGNSLSHLHIYNTKFIREKLKSVVLLVLREFNMDNTGRTRDEFHRAYLLQWQILGIGD